MKKLLAASLPFISALLAPTKAFAADCSQLPPRLICISNYVTSIVSALLILSGTTALFMLAIGGFQWVMSGGDPKGIGKARSTLTYAIVGLVIVLLAAAIIKMLETFLGITLLTTTLSFN